jgi:lycopene cyclase domain-containing protein
MLDSSNGYLIFHAVFTVPLILVLAYLQQDLGEKRNRRRIQNIVILVLIAYVYTIPWDNFMISVETWWYGDIVWNTIIYAPVGEYLFFGIQTIIAGLYLYYLDFNPIPKETDLRLKIRIGGFLLIMLPFIFTFYLTIFGPNYLFYGSSIIAWTSPVIAIQWLVGGSYIIREWRKILYSIVPPTIYMWFIDGLAIYSGLWTISSQKTVGVSVGPLPVEEMLFFLSANIMTVFGMVLYEWVLEVWSNGDGVFIQKDGDDIFRLYYFFEKND